MAASAADVRSILSLPEPSATPGPSQLKKQAAPSARKPEGISRELYSLIGPSAPSLAALTKPRLKQKPNLGGGAKIKWECRTFKNNARQDSLQLRHWVKATTEEETEYPFAKYNVQSNVFTYSQDEYTRFLEDKEWTKEETDYLFQLARDYDVRWYVMYDRYDFPGGVPRSIDDLKERYYSVCRKLVRNRPWAGDETSKAQLIQSYHFDKERELTRKKYIVSLENRTPEQIAEEEALFIEIKRLEQNERRFKREREELLRTIAGIESGLPDIVEDEGLMNLSIDTKKKNKRSSTIMDLDSPSTPAIPATPVVKRPQTAKNAAFDAANCIIRTDPPATVPVTKAAHQPAHLRSYKLPVPKAAVAPKITAALAELGISHTRLVMPTRDNIMALEALVEATTTLVETKRMVDKVEYDIRILKSRLGMRESQGAEGQPAATDAMDVDEGNDGGEVVGEDGRAQSVVSTRSRKPARRSMSISSVDTSGTATTRAGTKRQKRG
ncbi:putative SANT/Myb-like domain of DAMP1 [Lyophyllum shimeji]|uniref:SWR1-complex protein 4 n=1 Tax=Lyophyllum shimeji TaxID=47721 RepID=A0A9P3PEH7_LYOSH|nr:putative SANT/Myb-like domain of DAMP1 [Lyophyllum shimeji]